MGREADRAFYLEAWNGNGSFEVDRIGRGHLHDPGAGRNSPLLGGIQPGPLTKYVGDALSEAEKADGLLQRFQVLVYPDQKDYEPSDARPNAKAKNRAYEIMEEAGHLGRRGVWGPPGRAISQVPGIRFSEDEQNVFDAWRSEVEPRYRTGEYPGGHREPHAQIPKSVRLPGLLIFEAVDFVAGASEGGSISEENALRAAGWCSDPETHVLRVYYPLLYTPGRRAQTLLGHLRMGDVKHGMKTREIGAKVGPDCRAPKISGRLWKS